MATAATSPSRSTRIGTISSRVAVPATTVLGITGLYQLADGPYGLDDGWAAVGFVL